MQQANNPGVICIHGSIMCQRRHTLDKWARADAFVFQKILVFQKMFILQSILTEDKSLILKFNRQMPLFSKQYFSLRHDIKLA